jgi:hypothetical protein
VRPAAAIAVAFAIAWVAYASAIPPFEGQDEIWHVLYAQTLAGGELPVQPRGGSGGDMFQPKEGTQPPLYYALAAPAFLGTDVETLRRSAIHNPHGSVGGPGVRDNRNLFAHPPGGSEIDTRMWLARAVSGLFGLGTVLLTWLAARLVAPGRAEVPLLAAALVGFLPGFLFVSALVSNDAPAAFAGSLGLYLGLRFVHGCGTPRGHLVAGAAVGLAALTKSSAALVGPLVVLALGARPAACLRVAAVAALVAGWWYARNLLLYGELTGLRRHLGRDTLWGEIPGPGEIVADLPGLAQSFVGLFGWFSVPMDVAVYWVYAALFGAGLLGLARRTGRADASRRGLLLCLAWVALVCAALLLSRLIFKSFHGRLLYPALGGFALLWAVGMPRRGAAHVAAALALAAVAVPWVYLRPAYAVPPPCAPDTATGRPAVAPVELAAGGADRSDVAPGGLLAVDLCWRVNQAPGRAWSVFAQVVDPSGRVLAQHDGFPGGGADATPWWAPGTLHADRHVLSVAADAPTPSVAELRVGLYDKASGQRMQRIDPTGADTIVLERLRVVHPLPTAATPPATGRWPRFDDGLVVLDVAHSSTPDELRGVVLLTTDRPILRSHTLSLQLVDDGGLVAQDDRLPRGGLYPTDAWRPGEVVPHEFALRAPPARRRLLLVVYDLPEGARVPAGGRDHVVLVDQP